MPHQTEYIGAKCALSPHIEEKLKQLASRKETQ